MALLNWFLHGHTRTTKTYIYIRNIPSWINRNNLTSPVAKHFNEKHCSSHLFFIDIEAIKLSQRANNIIFIIKMEIFNLKSLFPTGVSEDPSIHQSRAYLNFSSTSQNASSPWMLIGQAIYVWMDDYTGVYFFKTQTVWCLMKATSWNVSVC